MHILRAEISRREFSASVLVILRIREKHLCDAPNADIDGPGFANELISQNGGDAAAAALVIGSGHIDRCAVHIGGDRVQVKIAVGQADIHKIDNVRARVVFEGKGVIERHGPIGIKIDVDHFARELEAVFLGRYAGGQPKEQDQDRKEG